jgi:hypothetical protein
MAGVIVGFGGVCSDDRPRGPGRPRQCRSGASRGALRRTFLRPCGHLRSPLQASGGRPDRDRGRPGHGLGAYADAVALVATRPCGARCAWPGHLVGESSVSRRSRPRSRTCFIFASWPPRARPICAGHLPHSGYRHPARLARLDERLEPSILLGWRASGRVSRRSTAAFSSLSPGASFRPPNAGGRWVRSRPEPKGGV